MEALEREGFDPHIATERQRHHSATTPAAAEPASPPATAKEKMQAKLKTAEGRAVYSRRKVIVEPGLWPDQGGTGLSPVPARVDLAKIRGEWRLVCLTHNLLKIWRYGRSILVGGSGCAVIKGRVEGVV